MLDISRRLTDDEMRAIFLSPMVTTTETDEAVALRFEVTRARREEDALRLALETAARERDEARKERASYEAKLAAKWLLEEEYEAACGDRDAMARMVDDLRVRVDAMCALVKEWLDGNARLGRPKSIADQRFLNGLNAVMPPTFTHWSGTATKPEGEKTDER